MTEEPCPVCGERNPPRTQFCNFCGAYLGWDDAEEPTAPVLLDEPLPERPRPSPPPAGRRPPERVVDIPSGHVPVREPPPAAGPPPQPPPVEETRRFQVPPHVSGSTRSPASGGAHRHDERPGAAPEIDVDTQVQVEVSQDETVVVPGGAPGVVTVQITNTSTIVEAYDVTVVRPPPWLTVTPGRVELLPGSDEAAVVRLSIRPEDLVPVQQARLRLRVQAESDYRLRRDAGVDLVVGAVRAPLELRLEPSTLRARDSTTALFRVIVDNRRSNEPVQVHLSGTDPELAARFHFTPEDLEVPPGGAAAARVRVEAPLPEPGEQHTRTLTVTASDGRQEHEVSGTFIQASAPTVVDPLVSLRLDPSVVRLENASSGQTTVIVDNRRGSRPQRVTLSADDAESVVRFTISPDRLEVPARQVVTARVTMRADRPDGGEQVTRDITLSAWNGEDLVEARGSLVQISSDRRPLARAVLTILGGAAIVLGTFLPWTSNPAGTGHQWSFVNFDAFIGIPDDVVVRVLDRAQLLGLVSALVSAGFIALLLGVLALFGLVGQTGRLTRVAAVLCFLFVVVVLAALNVRAGVGLGGGAAIVLLGCVAAFVGGLLARR